MSRWVLRLILANVALFFLEQQAPALMEHLVLVPAQAWREPWTIISYMFLHDPNGFGHIFFNMLALFFFGSRLENRLGGKSFLGLYFCSGIMGALLSLLLAPHASIIGASGAVFGVMLGYAWFWPRDQILIWGIFPIEARWLIILTTAITLWSGFRGGGTVAHFAHLGGFVGGYLFLRLQAKRSGMERFRRATLPSAPRLETTASAFERWKKIRRDQLHEVNRDELDRILDKIGAAGIGSLTPGEREFLDRFSARH